MKCFQEKAFVAYNLLVSFVFRLYTFTFISVSLNHLFSCIMSTYAQRMVSMASMASILLRPPCDVRWPVDMHIRNELKVPECAAPNRTQLNRTEPD